MKRPDYNPSPHADRRRGLFHLAVTPATIGLQRVMEVWHAAGIAIIRGRIGAVEPPIVSRIAVIGNAVRRMTMKNNALKRSGKRRTHAVADAKASRIEAGAATSANAITINAVFIRCLQSFQDTTFSEAASRLRKRSPESGVRNTGPSFGTATTIQARTV